MGLCPPRYGRIWGVIVRLSAVISMFSAGLALSACAMPDTDSFRAPDASALFSARSVSNYRDKVLPPVAPADLVDASGNCAAADASIPPVPAVIALEMTECDVVKRAGVAERAEIGINDRRERTATLTYTVRLSAASGLTTQITAADSRTV